MSDAHLQELRRLAKTGDPAALHDLLRERARRGEISAEAFAAAEALRERVLRAELSEERLELAACLGHAPARLALGGTPEGFGSEEHFWVLGPRYFAKGGEGTPRLVRALDAVGHEAALRAGLAMARAHEPTLSPAEREDVQQLFGLVRLVLIEGHEVSEEEWDALTASFPFRSTPRAMTTMANPVITSASYSFSTQQRLWAITCDQALVNARLLSDVAPWVLGEGDPLADEAPAIDAPDAAPPSSASP